MAENQTLEAPVVLGAGHEGRARARCPTLFDGIVNMPVMHQAVKAFLANRRQGTASTKTRGKVTGGNQKPWKQKGTGRARQGSIRAPNWPGGGTVFGPIPRSYTQIVPKQVKQLARKSAFNARAREGAVVIVDAFDCVRARRRRRCSALMASIGAADKKVLLLTDGVKQNVYLSARNIERAHVMPYSDAQHVPHPLVGCRRDRGVGAERYPGRGRGCRELCHRQPAKKPQRQEGAAATTEE